jgi:hypothetical protein
LVETAFGREDGDVSVVACSTWGYCKYGLGGIGVRRENGGKGEVLPRDIVDEGEGDAVVKVVVNR